MTPDAINQAIAEECGLKIVDGTGLFNGRKIIKHWDGPDDPYELGRKFERAIQGIRPMPNFYGDLNACADMEATLAYDPNFTYEKFLHIASNGRGERATAPQRCEAFLRVKGRWPATEGKEAK